MRRGEAEQTLRGLGWTGDFNEVEGTTDDPNELNKIIEQSVAPNTKINKDQDIGITIATQLGVGG